MEGPHDHVFPNEGGAGAAGHRPEGACGNVGAFFANHPADEASVGTVRGVVESLTKVVDALGRAGVELIGEHARSENGGRGVRLKEPGPPRRK